ncbi:MAG TPA: hypothetical protein VFS11_08845 [Gemmatimonadales bacterium]|nr:hypothetical protein [Gemmatimonadales bacterium]
MVELDRGITRARETFAARPQEGSRNPGVAMEFGSYGESVGGGAAVVLAILGLIGLLPLTLDAVAAIVLGVAMLLGGAAVSRRFSRLLPEGTAGAARREISGALGLQAIAGIAGIVLGVLAVLGIRPLELLSIAAIVFGAALLVAGGGMARLGQSARWLRGEAGTDAEAAYGVGGGDAVIGAAAVVLGIIALTHPAPIALTLVAMLCVGAALLISGSVIPSRVFGVLG